MMMMKERVKEVIYLLVTVVTAAALSYANIVQVPEERPSYCFEDPGNGCRATHSRYFYNHTAGECQFFYYGGCGGGRNIFTRKTECETACKRSQDAMRAVNNDLKCSFDINYGKDCYAATDDLSLDIELCGHLPFNFFGNEALCESNGCCWHPHFKICYQRTEPAQPVTCKITYASDSVFFGKVVVTSDAMYRNLRGWVGILSLDKQVNGEFCLIKDEFSDGVATLKRVNNYRQRDKFFVNGPLSPVYEGMGNTRAIHFTGHFNSSTSYDRKMLGERCSDYSIP